MKLRFNNFAFGSLLAGTIIMMVVMFVSGRPLTTAGTPQGILCLEFATSADEVEEVLNSWKMANSKKTDVIQAARNNTYLDFIFLLFYS